MFEGEKVRLRSFELSDIDDIMAHWNDLEFRETTGSVVPSSREEKLEFIRQTWQLRSDERHYFFAIEDLNTKKFLGHVSLGILKRNAGSSDLGIFIYDKKNWDKGFGTDTMRVILKIGFDYLNLHRIELGVYPNNERAIHVYKKIGFKEVGRKRECRFMSGEYKDEIIMDILKREWLELKNEL